MQTKTQERVIGKEVEFCLGDIPAEQLRHLRQHITGDLELVGRVLDYVEFGNPPEPYVVMEVRGIKPPMLVPVSALQP